jgi:hypothetical protein
MPGSGAAPGSGPCERGQDNPEEQYAMTQDGWDGHGLWMNEERPSPADVMPADLGAVVG